MTQPRPAREPWSEPREIAAFFLLAYALSWWASLFEPHTLIPLGPWFATLVTLGAFHGRSAVVEFVRRLARWRAAPGWYVLVLAGPPAIALAAVAINRMLGAAAPAADRLPPLAAAPATFAGIFLFIGLGEEPAWRGYALPRLQRVATPIGGVLLLWLLHALWHLPLFGSEYDWSNGPPWLLGLLGYTIATTWLYRRTDGNLLLPALLHASLNTAARYVFAPLQPGPDLLRVWWLWGSLWCVAGIVSGMSLARLDSRTARRGVSSAA
jgi:membrane protease YdiL (CAAX protease family)